MSKDTNGSNGSQAPSESTSTSATVPVSRVYALASSLVSRIFFGRATGLNSTYNGRRDLNLILGYDFNLEYQQYRERYERGGIAKRIIEIFPYSTWGNGFEIVEDSNLKRLTPFEKSIDSLLKSDRLQTLAKIIRADIQARIGHYSAILIGVPSKGSLDTPLDRGRGNPDNIAYLLPLAENQIQITELVGQSNQSEYSDPRFGLPKFYQINLSGSIGSISTFTNIPQVSFSGKIHWTRVIHIAHNPIDNEVYAPPYLKAVWNYLDDLQKLVGGGSEAFLRRAWPGLHANIDKDTNVSGPNDPLMLDMKNQLDEYNLGLTNGVRTRGVDLNTITSEGNIQFGPNVGSIIDLISSTLGVAREHFIGSELGLRSSEKNDDSFNDMVTRERKFYCEPVIIKQLITRLVDFGYLPIPRNPRYEIKWPESEEMSEVEKAEYLKTISEANKAQTEAKDTVFLTSDEIRDTILGGLKPLTPKPIVVDPNIPQTEVDSNPQIPEIVQ